jgi:hypothetical protein
VARKRLRLAVDSLQLDSLTLQPHRPKVHPPVVALGERGAQDAPRGELARRPRDDATIGGGDKGNACTVVTGRLALLPGVG